MLFLGERRIVVSRTGWHTASFLSGQFAFGQTVRPSINVRAIYDWKRRCIKVFHTLLRAWIWPVSCSNLWVRSERVSNIAWIPLSCFEFIPVSQCRFVLTAEPWKDAKQRSIYDKCSFVACGEIGDFFGDTGHLSWITLFFCNIYPESF